MRTRIKICGITRESDLQFAAESGADAVGLVFQPQSPRCLNIRQAQALVKDKPPFVSVVALFADPEEKDVRQVLEAVKIDYLQFHGSESEDFCTAFNIPYLKAVPMGSLQDSDTYIGPYVDTASGIVLDSHQIGQCGGTGKVFDWSKINTRCDIPIILAGGLKPENVGDSIMRLRPYGVDVSSGVEATPGIKDHERLQKFIQAVNEADLQEQ